MRKFSLQTRILGLTFSLSLLLIILLTSYYTYMEGKQIVDDKGRLALELSKTISSMPSITNAFDAKNPSKIIQPITEKIRKKTGAEFIVIGNKEGIRYSHPDPTKIGKEMVGGDNDRAILKGQSYISEAKGSLGLSMRGKTPILNKKGEIIGIVSVGFLVKDIEKQIFNDISKELLISVLALLISIIGSYLLARSIRNETLGLEPYEIAHLYKEKNAVLHSVQEGILSIDQNGKITSMNQPAKKMLGVNGSVRNLQIDGFFPSNELYDVLKSGKSKIDIEISWKQKEIIVSCTPIFDKERVRGVVASFREKTEIEQMMNTLSEMKTYSEELRAQTHEFTNKLYVLSGLMQLGEYDEAIEMIQSETSVLQIQNQIVFEQIKDKKIQVILLGKIGVASEKKILFEINSESYLEQLPDHILLSQLTLILGNIIDNAFDAVANVNNPIIKFFATDIGENIVFEVSDNGKGISDGDVSSIFQMGFTSKEGESKRGYGLANADKAVKELGGMIEVDNGSENTVFTVYLPKDLQGGE